MNILVSSLTTIGFLHSVIIRSVVISILQICLIFMQQVPVGLPHPLLSPSPSPFSAFQHVFSALSLSHFLCSSFSLFLHTFSLYFSSKTENFFHFSFRLLLHSNHHNILFFSQFQIFIVSKSFSK